MTLTVGDFTAPDTPDRRHDRRRDGDDRSIDAVRVAVIRGGRSSEHQVSLRSGAAVAEGLRAAGHETVDVVIEPDGRWLAEGAEVDLRAAAAACSAATSPSRSCTGRSARTGPCRGCSSASTSPTSAPACWPPR